MKELLRRTQGTLGERISGRIRKQIVDLRREEILDGIMVTPQPYFRVQPFKTFGRFSAFPPDTLWMRRGCIWLASSEERHLCASTSWAQ